VFNYIGDIPDPTNWQSMRAPQLVDVDRDNRIDMVVGELEGKLAYYHNEGTTAVPNFLRVDSEWGGVDVETDVTPQGYSVPQLVPDGPGGTYRLYVGRRSGHIYLYDNIEGNLAGNFNLVTKIAADTFIGGHTSPAIADINDDNKLDMVVGNTRGGLAMLTTQDWTVGVEAPSSNPLTMAVFPVPAREWLVVSLSTTPPGSWTFELRDLSGKMVAAGTHTGSRIQLDVTGLSSGVYVGTAVGQDFRRSVKVVITP
jgi:hypothetical protein